MTVSDQYSPLKALINKLETKFQNGCLSQQRDQLTSRSTCQVKYPKILLFMLCMNFLQLK